MQIWYLSTTYKEELTEEDAVMEQTGSRSERQQSILTLVAVGPGTRN